MSGRCRGLNRVSPHRGGAVGGSFPAQGPKRKPYRFQTISRPLFISCQFPFYRPEPARRRRLPGFNGVETTCLALTCLGLLFKERKPLTKLDRNLTEFYREKKLGRSSFSSNLPVLHRLAASSAPSLISRNREPPPCTGLETDWFWFPPKE